MKSTPKFESQSVMQNNEKYNQRIISKSSLPSQIHNVEPQANQENFDFKME